MNNTGASTGSLTGLGVKARRVNSAQVPARSFSFRRFCVPSSLTCPKRARARLGGDPGSSPLRRARHAVGIGVINIKRTNPNFTKLLSLVGLLAYWLDV